MKQSRQQFALRQIACGAEHYDDMRRNFASRRSDSASFHGIRHIHDGSQGCLDSHPAQVNTERSFGSRVPEPGTSLARPRNASRKACTGTSYRHRRRTPGTSGCSGQVRAPEQGWGLHWLPRCPAARSLHKRGNHQFLLQHSISTLVWVPQFCGRSPARATRRPATADGLTRRLQSQTVKPSARS